MARFRKKPVVIEATQWFKNGDHPEDRWTSEGVAPEGEEGIVVRYFRRPDVSGASLCSECGQPFDIHGWIDTKEDGHRVCPGDWIITGVQGERYPCKPDIFQATYDPIGGTPERCPSKRPGTGERCRFDARHTGRHCGDRAFATLTPEDESIRWD